MGGGRGRDRKAGASRAARVELQPGGWEVGSVQRRRRWGVCVVQGR